MKKYTVEKIRDMALCQKEDIKDMDGHSDHPEYPSMSVNQMRAYCGKVLFLCKEIERLRKKLKESQ